MKGIRIIAWAWRGVGALFIGLAIYLTVEQVRGEGFTKGFSLFEYLLYGLFVFVGGLLIVAGRGVQRYNKHAWIYIVMLSAGGALACVGLAFAQGTTAGRLALLAGGALFFLCSLRVLLAREVRTRVWRPEIPEAGEQAGQRLGGVPVRIVVIVLAAVLARAVFFLGAIDILPS